MKKKRILCLLSKVGGAHEKLASIFHERLHQDFYFEAVDLYSETSRFCDGSIKLYARVLKKIPRFYNFFYSLNDSEKGWDFFYTNFIKRLMLEKTAHLIDGFKPDLILSLFALTTRLAADALDVLRGSCRSPIAVFIVDPFTIHYSWIERRATLNMISGSEGVDELIKAGVPPASIRMVKFPLSKGFVQKNPRNELKRKYGTESTKTTALIMGGADGLLPADLIARRLLMNIPDFQVIAVAGRNRDLYSRLKKLAVEHPGRLLPFEYSEAIHELMSISDIIITKPGPSTIYEAIAMKLPIILTGFVPAQEKGNLSFVSRKGFGKYAAEPDVNTIKGFCDVKNLSDIRSCMAYFNECDTKTQPWDEIATLLEGKHETVSAKIPQDRILHI